jgi:hypothetical protein
MLTVRAFNKYVDLRRSFKLFYLIALVAFFSVLTFVVYQNIVVTVTVVACGIAGYIVLSGPKKEIQVQLSEEGLIIDDEALGWDKAIAWAMVDLGDSFEFVIQSTGFAKDFYYFYINPEDPNMQEIVRMMSMFAPYDETITGLNRSHNVLRAAGMK